ncbi:hypothetical protein FRC07_003408 [Ceratobasidium sp. 392]|nr:hypothetical protein FRC07_003408 [Ceratobasidium sp. 392]
MDLEMSRPFLEMFGPNISTVEGETWRTHRRIVQLAFTDKNLQLVWSETEHVIEKLFELWDEQQGREVHISNAADITKKISLMVFSAAALGRRMSWDQEYSSGIVPPGYFHSFQRALSIVSGGIIARLITPSWAEHLTSTTRTLASGFRDFKKYLLAMEDLYRKDGKLDQDLIGSEDSGFTTSENLFMNILVAASEQGAEAQSVPFSQKEITDMNELKLITGVLLEALRLYPALPQLSRNADEDFIVTTASNAPGADEGIREKMLIPAGSKIVISVAATHYNRTYSVFSPMQRLKPLFSDVLA